MNKMIIEIFEDVPDYKKGNAIKHKLVDLLTIGLLSVICNRDAISEMELFGETHKALLSEFLELPHGIPSADKFERVFSKLDPRALSAQFQTFMQEIKALMQEHATESIDGKTIRRSKGVGKKATRGHGLRQPAAARARAIGYR